MPSTPPTAKNTMNKYDRWVNVCNQLRDSEHTEVSTSPNPVGKSNMTIFEQWFEDCDRNPTWASFS